MGNLSYGHERPVCAHPQCDKHWENVPQEPWMVMFAGGDLSVVQGVTDVLHFDRWRCLQRYAAMRAKAEAVGPVQKAQ